MDPRITLPDPRHATRRPSSYLTTGVFAVYSLGAVSVACGGGEEPHGLGAPSRAGTGGSAVIVVNAGQGGGSSIPVGGTTAAGGMTSGPTGLPAGYTPATLGGFKVGDPITTDAAQPTPTTDSGCGTTILAVIRDFQDDGINFENPALSNRNTDDPGIVAATLGADQKPVYAATGSTATIQDAASFDTFYRNVPGTNQPFVFYVYFAPSNGVSSFSSTAFYPLDGLGFGDSGNDDQRMPHNFHFTTEIHTAFQYQGGEIFSFTGDDDVWVFINNQLVIDLGGVHAAETATVEVDTLGLTLGQVYPFDMFQTERHTTQSNFRADTTLTFVNCGTIVSGEPK